MKKRFLAVAVGLLMACSGVFADNRQTVVIDGQTLNQNVTRLTFNGDNVDVTLDDGTTRTADMEAVSLSFDWQSQPIDDNIPGDVNGDKVVNLEDVKQIIASITSIGTTVVNADVNKDGKTGIADVMYVLNIMSETANATRRAAEELMKWDFSQKIESDSLALRAASSEWTYTVNNNRFENVNAINGTITAGGKELTLTQGLTVSAKENKLRIDYGKRIQLAGSNIPLTTPALKKGQMVTITFASTGDKVVTFDQLTNLTNASGFVAADKNTVQTGTATVAEDGSVSFASTTGSINIFSIEVSGTPDPPSPPSSQDITDNAVARNINVNQARLTLTNGNVYYYNTGNLLAVDIDNQTGLISLTTQSNAVDLYYASVSGISFVKKLGDGQEPVIENGGVTITESRGWLESLYAKWDLCPGALGYEVYVHGGQYADWTKVDDQLVRNYGTYARVDVVGLAAGTYELMVKPVFDASAEMPTLSNTYVYNITVKSYSRQGFAFKDGYAPGAYNADGTLKQGAKVLYVTAKTAKTISTDVAGAITNPCVGLQTIIAAYEKGQDKTPIAFRFIGLVTKDDLDAIGSSEEGIQVKGRRADSELNLTFEGIGDDATLRGFGFLVRNSKSVEFRNLGVMRCMDDGISLDTDNSNIWVHHCDFFYGKHGSGDHDKGDGQVDVKSDSKLVTVSYNRFWDTGKTNMFGMKSESGPNYISYDHNWFDHSDSRHPRVRTMSVHVWNNYFDNVAKYGVGATSGASVFVENNYFLKTKKPILASLQGTDGLGSGTFSGEDGGMIKAYGNYFDRSAIHFSYYTQKALSSKGYDAYETATRDEQVPATEVTLVGGTGYDNFDTNAQVMYQYDVAAATDVPSIVTGYYGAGRLNHGDFTYTFNDNVGVDDTDSGYDSTLGGLLDNYQSSFVGFFGEESQGGGDTPVDPDPDDPIVNPTPEGTILLTFTDKNGTPSITGFFTISGNYSNSKGTATIDGQTYQFCLKMESATSIKFTIDKPYVMTLYFADTETASIKINGTKIVGTGSTYTQQLSAGNYELTKDKSVNLFGIKLEPVSE